MLRIGRIGTKSGIWCRPPRAILWEKALSAISPEKALSAILICGEQKLGLFQPKTLLLGHNILYPDVPVRPPLDHKNLLGRRSDFWRRTAKVLWLVSSGFCLGLEIRILVADSEGADRHGGAIKSLVPRLIEKGMLRSTLVERQSGYKMRLTALGPNSAEIIRRLKWQPVETEWERMVRLHEKGKDGEERHTLSVITFAYQARLRGYQAGVMPVVDGNRLFAPDAVVIQDGTPVMVEVERLYKRKVDKWQNMADYQGYVAICGRTEKHRKRLIHENEWELDIPGRATDLQTLFKESWEQPYGPLWSEMW